MSSRKLILGLTVILSFSTACIKFSSPPIPDKTPTWKEHDEKLKSFDAQLKEISAEIQKLQGKVLCDNSSQCKVTGLGIKVCGNFKDYLIYSTKDVNGKAEELLLVKIKHFNTVFGQMIQQMINVPSCGRPPLTAVCVEGHCDPKKD